MQQVESKGGANLSKEIPLFIGSIGFVLLSFVPWFPFNPCRCFSAIADGLHESYTFPQETISGTSHRDSIATCTQLYSVGLLSCFHEVITLYKGVCVCVCVSIFQTIDSYGTRAWSPAEGCKLHIVLHGLLEGGNGWAWLGIVGTAGNRWTWIGMVGNS